MKYKCLLWMITVLAGMHVHEVQCADDMSAHKAHGAPRKRAKQNNQNHLKILLSAFAGIVLLDILYTYYGRPRQSPAASYDESESLDQTADQNIERKEEVKDIRVPEHQQDAEYPDYRQALLNKTPLPEVVISIIQEYLGDPCVEYQDAKNANIRCVQLGMRGAEPRVLFQEHHENRGIISIVDPRKDGQLCCVACLPRFEPSFSQNGKFVSAYDNNVFHAYDTQTGRKVQSYCETSLFASLFGGQSDVRRMAFTKNDELVVTYAYGKTTVWDTQNGQQLRTIKSSLPFFTINDHETKLLVARQPSLLQGGTRKLIVVDLKTQEPKIITIPCRSSQRLDAVLTPAGNEVVVSVKNKHMYDIFNTATGARVRTIAKNNPFSKPIKALYNEANNHLILHDAWGNWSDLTLYNCDEKNPVIYATRSTTPYDTARSVQLDRKKEFCLVGGVRYPYQIIAVEDGQVVYRSERENNRQQGLISLVLGGDKSSERALFNERSRQASAHWGPEEKSIITTDWTGDVCIYDAKTHELIKNIKKAGHTLMFSYCKQWMLVRNSAENKTTVWYVPQMIEKIELFKRRP